MEIDATSFANRLAGFVEAIDMLTAHSVEQVGIEGSASWGAHVAVAISAARALRAEPTLGPAQALEIYDPLVAKIEAVLEHRRALVATRTLMVCQAPPSSTVFSASVNNSTLTVL